MTKVSGVGVVLLWAIACGGSPPEPAEPMTELEPAQEAATPAAADDTVVGAEQGEPAAETPKGEPAAASEEGAKPPGKRVEETRTSQVIKDVVDRHRDSVRRCFDALSKDEKGTGGMLTIAFKLSSRGDVKSASLNEARSTLKQPRLVSCAVDAMKAIKFPPSSRGFESSVNYPFNFKP